LGTAFTDLPSNLYPTVGLQTPGEIVDANFGQEPFVFDLNDMILEMRNRIRDTIVHFPVQISQGEWQGILNRMVSSYLIHHGYSGTAEALANTTDTQIYEDLPTIRNRQKILKLVLAGRIGEAIERTNRQYPGLLEKNPNLLFMLKCRQFVEMVNGTDSDCSSTRSVQQQTSVIQSTKTVSNKAAVKQVEELNQNNVAMNGSSGGGGDAAPVIKQHIEDGGGGDDVEMDEVQNGHGNCVNGKSSNGYQNGNTSMCVENEDEDMDTEDSPVSRKWSKPAVERILEFGKELNSMSQRLPNENGSAEANQEMLQNVFSLLAYSNPWDSPVGWQLSPSERETVYAQLNSAILELQNKPRRPPLELALGHAQELVQLMSASGLACSAFASVSEILKP